MSEYQVLARKYRPKNFSQLLGQTHVSQALSNAIDTKRLHHAYLFTGTRGVGKTTIARILAKCLNCQTGISSTPCGVCDTCLSIDGGRFIDLIEIDAASRTKVEDTRELLENVPYAPTQGRYKVYLIDEVHMLSTHSFNALLKTLEEPPEHVKFILATTDPQKLPITIMSRCLQFVLRPMSQELLHMHLTKILQQEKIVFDDTALWHLAQSAKGSVRDALSLTDQAIAFGRGQINTNTVTKMLGLVDSLDVLDLIYDIYHDNRQKVAGHIVRMREQMVDAIAMIDRLVDTLHSMALVQIMPDVPLDMNDEQKQAFFELANVLPADVIQLYYEICNKSRQSVRFATTPMQALEMGILRLLAFRPLATNEMIKIESLANVNQCQNMVKVSMDDNHALDKDKPSNNHLDVKSNHSLIVDDDGLLPNNQRSSSNKSVEDDPLYPSVMFLPSNDEDVGRPSMEISLDVMDDTDGVLDEIDDRYLDKQACLKDELTRTSTTAIKPIMADASNINFADSPSQSDDQLEPTVHSKHALQVKLIAPQVELLGEWTAQKWDYWLALARQDDLFNNDELALLHSSRMMGAIDGKSTLYVENHNSQVNVSFNSAKTKIISRLPNLQLQDDLPLLNDTEKATVPYRLQKNRDAQVMMDAQNQVIQSPVVKMLWEQGFIDNDGDDTHILSGTKLTLND